jgi:hypothetical protein
VVNEIDFSDPSFVMNRFLSLERAIATLEAEVASLRINQQLKAEIAALEKQLSNVVVYDIADTDLMGKIRLKMRQLSAV